MGTPFAIGEAVVVYYREPFTGEESWRGGAVVSRSILNRRMYSDHDPAYYYTVRFLDGTTDTIFAGEGILSATATEQEKEQYLRWYTWRTN